MKKASLVILIIFTLGIMTLTIYTLTHQEIKGSQEIRKTKSIEKASSNMTTNELNEIYNIELNGKRHRLKCNYYVTFEDNIATVDLTLYLDGFEILNKELAQNVEAEQIEEIFDSEGEMDYLRIKEENITILKTDEDYLLLNIYSNIDSVKEEYFVWNTNKEPILENILVYDEAINYASTSDEELNIFYDENRQVLAKIEDNEIYALEQKENEDNLIIEEYLYTIKNNKVDKEKINTYENIEIKEVQ